MHARTNGITAIDLISNNNACSAVVDTKIAHRCKAGHQSGAGKFSPLRHRVFERVTVIVTESRIVVLHNMGVHIDGTWHALRRIQIGAYG